MALQNLALMGLTLVSRLLGYLRSSLTLWLFGSGSVSDALNAVFSLPNGLRKLLAEGNLGQSYALSFSPIKDFQIPSPWHLLLKQWAWSIPLALAGWVMSPWLAAVFFPFGESEAIASVRSALGPSFFYLPLAAASSVPAGLLSARGQNLRLLCGTLAFSGVTIVGLLLLFQNPLWNWGWLIAAGGAAQLLCFLLLAEVWSWPVLGRKAPGQVRGWFSNLGFHVIPVLVYQVLIGLLSKQGPGAVTAFTLEFTLLQVPLGILVHARSMDVFSKSLKGRVEIGPSFFSAFSGLLPWMFLIALAVGFFGSDVTALLFGEPYTPDRDPLFLLPLILGIPGFAAHAFLHKVYSAQGKSLFALGLSGLGQGVGFLFLEVALPWVWTLGVCFAAIFLFLPQLGKILPPEKHGQGFFIWLFGLACLYLVFWGMDKLLASVAVFLRVALPSLVGTGVLVGWSYITESKGVRFWEEQSLS